jgi:hypothetical protein
MAVGFRSVFMRRVVAVGIVVAIACVAASWQVRAQQAPSDGPRYAADGKLLRPADYREWMFLTAGLGMTYGPAASPSASSPRFDNVFVNRSAYRHFMQTGAWPDKTMFILEIRTSASEGSINRGGHYQTNVAAIEAAVKDEARFPDKWAYFNFGGGANIRESVDALPRTASCYTCHSQNTAVENTFVQFYPTLLEVARAKGTVKPSYNPTPTPQQ